ncbi:hypothetical protein F2Q69_00021731 [Brassica cretica]|uniref:Uncharacterized protein n=1 Tax=Brassica cretica TaxID=69181 RepID=A0A8S9QMV7_BRACR|nr:hypothetical protein F2Q69_00021731 [Brassica cretica]
MKPQTPSRRNDDLELIAACHCGAEYEIEYSASIKTHTATSIDSANQKSIDIHKEESIDSSPGDWENDYYNPTMAMHTTTLQTEEYDEVYEEERAIEYIAIISDEDRLLHHSSWKRNATSIDRCFPTSIDAHLHQTSCKRASTDIAYYPSIDTRVDRVREGDYSIRSWADDHCHESFALETAISQPRADELHEGFTTETILNMRERDKVDQHQAEAGGGDDRSKRPKFGKRTYDRDGTRRFHWEEKDEYGVYIDDYGHARDIEGHIIIVSNDDIRSLLEGASMDEHSYLCLPEHARSFTQTKLVPEIYTKDEINEIFYGVCGAQEKNEGDFQMKLDGVYYPLNDSISWLTTCMEETKQDIAKIQTERAAEETAPASIERKLSISIDDNPPHSNPLKSQPDSYTKEEIDQLVEEIYRTLESAEERLDRRCDDIYFPLDLTMSSLTSQVEAIQSELVEIQIYIARRPEASTSIDRRINISTDEATPATRGRLVPKIKSDMSDTNNHGEAISDDAYATLIRNQFQLESLGERLQKIENATATMKDK